MNKKRKRNTKRHLSLFIHILENYQKQEPDNVNLLASNALTRHWLSRDSTPTTPLGISFPDQTKNLLNRRGIGHKIHARRPLPKG